MFNIFNLVMGDAQGLYFGLSKDKKPTSKDIPLTTGAIFIEIDTGKAYMYDASNKK